MPITLEKLPDDVAELQKMLREVVVDATKQQSELIAENDKLRMLIERLLRRDFGRRSEKLSADQLLLALEDIEQSIAQNQEAEDAAADNAIRPNSADPKPRASRPKRNLGALPIHLPRYEVLIDVDNHDCPCCGGTLHVIDEVRSEQLDHVPSQLRVRVTRRPRYGCRACESAVVVAPAPERPIDGGMPTEALVVHVLVSKYCDSLPLHRQTKIFARQTAQTRKRVRQERSRSIVEALHIWLQEQVGRISAASDLSKAIGYALRHWTGLVVFLDDGRVELDNNIVERAIKPVVLNRKNALFAGSDGGAECWASVMTLIETAKLNGVNPQAWLTDALERIVSGRTKSHQLHTLLPWNWSAPEDGELAVAA